MTVEQLRTNIGISGFDFKFKIDKVMRAYTGTGQYGPWQLQNVVVSDSTGKIQVNLKNNLEIPASAVGAVLHVRCKEVNGELKGTSVEQESFTADDGSEKTSIKIIVTKSALVTIEGLSGSGPTHHPNQPTNAPQIASNEAISGAIIEASTLLCSNEASRALRSAVENGWTSEDVRAVAITLFLHANRR